MSVLESAVERRVKQWADEHGILNAKLTPMNAGGYPDRMFFIDGGRPLLVEFKKPGAKPSKLQAYIIAQLSKRGYDVRWTSSAEQAIEWLRQELRSA